MHGLKLNQQDGPLISIITATFNAALCLPDAIRSVRAQRYPNVEWIVIEGGSTDATVELLSANETAIDYWVSEPDDGIYNAWNKGLAKATGDWICFLGADDYFWGELTLQQVAPRLAEIDENVLVAYAQITLLNGKGESIHLAGEPWEKIKSRFNQIMCLNHQGVLHRRRLFELHGKFDESFRIAGDYELLLRELPKGDAEFLPGIIFAGMRQGGVSSSPKNSLALLHEIRRAQKLHGRGLPGMVWMMAAARTYLRLFIWRVLGESRARRLLDIGRRIMGLPPFWTRAE